MDSTQPAGARQTIPSSAAAESPPYVVTLPLRAEAQPSRAARPVPDVRGLDLREAVRSLHNAGFRVQLARGDAKGGGVATTPARGALAPAGSVVRLVVDY